MIHFTHRIPESLPWAGKEIQRIQVWKCGVYEDQAMDGEMGTEIKKEVTLPRFLGVSDRVDPPLQHSEKNTKYSAQNEGTLIVKKVPHLLLILYCLNLWTSRLHKISEFIIKA